MRSLPIVALAAVVAAWPAHASLVHFAPVTLEQLLAQSTLVAVGKRVKPDERAGYRSGDEAFTIVEVLKGPPARRGQTVLVAPANRALMDAMSVHYAAHGNEGMPSPIVTSYASSLADARYLATPKVIVFLTCPSDEPGTACAFAVEHAHEAVAKRGEILRLLKQKAIDDVLVDLAQPRPAAR